MGPALVKELDGRATDARHAQEGERLDWRKRAASFRVRIVTEVIRGLEDKIRAAGHPLKTRQDLEELILAGIEGFDSAVLEIRDGREAGMVRAPFEMDTLIRSRTREAVLERLRS